MPPKRPDAVADAILSLLKDTALREQLGAAARRNIEERFDRATQASRLLALFQGAEPGGKEEPAGSGGKEEPAGSGGKEEPAGSGGKEEH